MAATATPTPRALPDVDAGVIEEARARQRRHRVVAALLSVALIALAVGAYFGSNEGTGAGSSRSRSPARLGLGTTEAAAVVFARDPDLGVSCRVPSWIGCDRVGLAIWLRRPALAASATIAGSPLRLDDPMWSGAIRNGRRTTFAGFLQPAGITTRLHVKPDPGTQSWIGSNQPTPTIWFRISYGHGQIVLTHEDVGLRAGWG